MTGKVLDPNQLGPAYVLCSHHTCVPLLCPQLLAYNEVAREGLSRWTDLDLNSEFTMYQLCDLGPGAFLSLSLSFFICQMG